jgi:hypothetical protein
MKNLSENSPTPKWKSWAENIKLLTETFNNIMPIIKIIAGVMGMFLLILFIQAQFNGDDDIDRYIADAKRFQEEAQLAVAFADSLKVEVEIREMEASQAIERANNLGQQVRTLRNQTTELREQVNSVVAAAPPLTDFTYSELLYFTEQVMPQQQEIIIQQENIINIQAEQIEQLETAIIWKDEAILLLTQSNDSLQFVLKNPPTIPSSPNKMFGITLPSRTTSFIAGVATGVAAIVVITK